MESKKTVIKNDYQFKRLVAVYGTLRTSQSNNRVIQHSTTKSLGITKTLPEFTLKNLGGFPCVCLNGKTPVTIEVFEVNDEEVSRRVNSLEGYTGERDSPENWYNTVEIPTEFGTAEMFIMSEDEYPSAPVIETGDWMDRQRRY